MLPAIIKSTMWPLAGLAGLAMIFAVSYQIFMMKMTPGELTRIIKEVCFIIPDFDTDVDINIGTDPDDCLKDQTEPGKK